MDIQSIKIVLNYTFFTQLFFQKKGLKDFISINPGYDSYIHSIFYILVVDIRDSSVDASIFLCYQFLKWTINHLSVKSYIFLRVYYE